MSRDSDLDKIIKRAEAQGWRHEMTSGGHHQFLAPDGVGIVTTGGTPSAPLSWDNFLADMRRHGYQEADPYEREERPPNGGGKLTVKQYLIDLLARHPEGMWPKDAKAYIDSVLPGAHESAAYNAMGLLVKSGLAVKTPSGKYVLSERKLNGHTQHVEPQQFVIDASEEGSDGDLAVLDEALNVLSKLDAVIRKNREVLRQLTALKTLLGAR
jgi:predicted RNA binding protein YcfA (HicA-like mRNA interferase family)